MVRHAALYFMTPIVLDQCAEDDYRVRELSFPSCDLLFLIFLQFPVILFSDQADETWKET